MRLDGGGETVFWTSDDEVLRLVLFHALGKQGRGCFSSLGMRGAAWRDGRMC